MLVPGMKLKLEGKDADGNDGGDGDNVDIADDGEVGDGDCDGLKGKWNYATGQKLQFSSETL